MSAIPKAPRDLTCVDYLNGMIKSGNLDQLFRVLNEDQPCWLTPGAKYIKPDPHEENPRKEGDIGQWEINETLKIDEINRKGPRTGRTLFETAMAHPQKNLHDQSRVLEKLREWGAVLSPSEYSPASSVSISPLDSPSSSFVLPSASSLKEKGVSVLKVDSLALLFRLSHVPGDELDKRLAPDWRGGLGNSGGEKSAAAVIPPRQARAFMGLTKLARKAIPDLGADPLG